MAYQRTTWVNSPTETTPINDTNLNNMEVGIETNDTSALSGWNVLGATLTYSSADAPTFVASTSVDLTGVISVGMKLKLTQTTVKYFIVTAISTTTITLYGGTDYTLANAAITLPYYSVVKAPFGFPMSKGKWTITVTDTNNIQQLTPTQNTWYNIKTITLPIGSWSTEVETVLVFTIGGTAAYGSCFMTLSTANNTAGASKLNTGFYLWIPWTTGQSVGQGAFMADNITITEKTVYYLNIQTTDTGVASIRSGANAQGLTIKAVCNYL
jgi:hypothetical protein